MAPRASIIEFLLSQVRTTDGELVGGQVYFYLPGTTSTTGVHIWLDKDATLEASNPYTLDSNATAQLYATGTFRVIIKDSDGVTRYDRDNLYFNNYNVVSEWALRTEVPTYISATQFSVPTDLTTTYVAGTPIQAIVTAGTIQGFVLTSSYGSVTTVTCAWQATQSLDSGLSDIYLGIFPVVSNANPSSYVVTKTSSYTMTINDFGVDLLFNKASAITYTLLAANVVPSGFWVKIKNIGAGVLTLSGTVNGGSNPTLIQYDEGKLFSDGTSWYVTSTTSQKAINLTMNSEVSSTGSAGYTSISSLSVTSGDRIFVSAIVNVTGVSSVGPVSLMVSKGGGDATIVFGNSQTSFGIDRLPNQTAGGGSLAVSNVAQVTSTGSLILQSYAVTYGTPTQVKNEIYTFFLKKQ